MDEQKNQPGAANGERPSEAPKPRPTYSPENYWRDWIATLSTVFLCGATLTTLMKWCSGGYAWDAGGTVFSGVLAWCCYRLTLSEKAFPNVATRTNLAIGLPLIWALFFPIVVWGLGLK